MRRNLPAILAALCLLAACAAPAAETDGKWDPALARTLGLTQEQRLEDYDYFVKTLKDSYLCLGLRDRENPDDLAEDIFREYREMIEESDSDQAFYTALYSSWYRLGSYGHFWIIEPEDYDGMLDWCENQDTAGRERWKEAIEASREGYRKLKALLDGLGGGESGGGWNGGGTGENLHTLLSPEAGVAYLKVDSFLTDYDPPVSKGRGSHPGFLQCRRGLHRPYHRSDGQQRRERGLLAGPAGGPAGGRAAVLRPLRPSGGQRKQPALYRECVCPVGAPSHFGAS